VYSPRHALKVSLPTSKGSVANIYKSQAALICGRSYPANAIICL